MRQMPWSFDNNTVGKIIDHTQSPEQLAELYCRLCSLLGAVSAKHFPQANSLQDRDLATASAPKKLDNMTVVCDTQKVTAK